MGGVVGRVEREKVPRVKLKAQGKGQAPRTNEDWSQAVGGLKKLGGSGKGGKLQG